MPGDSRLKPSTQRAFGSRKKRAWNKKAPATRPPSAAELESRPDPLDLRELQLTTPWDQVRLAKHFGLMPRTTQRRSRRSELRDRRKRRPFCLKSRLPSASSTFLE
ncbi:hypothetical protein HPB52_018103 [Rhipicephalus sanguineus]|uniref:Uncharacterized protein n=1 Tax=Rhipicephalus sanguineus TaxID=34632 RepID=A0A9D4QAK9_RHISA|nr:hypothetical protein HPB52_018103 [Rhipicephalus sanguineus]